MRRADGFLVGAGRRRQELTFCLSSRSRSLRLTVPVWGSSRFSVWQEPAAGEQRYNSSSVQVRASGEADCSRAKAKAKAKRVPKL